MDPRFRKLKFLSNEQKEEVKTELLGRASVDNVSVCVENIEGPSQKKKKTAIDILLGEENDDSIDDGCDTQLTEYLAEKPIPCDAQPLEWWKQNESQFPHLSSVAKSLLCIPATSTPSERLFSTVGLTVTRLRNSLKPENVDSLLFLNKNAEFLGLL